MVPSDFLIRPQAAIHERLVLHERLIEKSVPPVTSRGGSDARRSAGGILGTYTAAGRLTKIELVLCFEQELCTAQVVPASCQHRSNEDLSPPDFPAADVAAGRLL